MNLCWHRCSCLKFPRILLLFLIVFGLILSLVSSVSAGVSVTSSNTGVPDISGSVYTKTQVITYYICFDKYFMPVLTGKDFSPLNIWWNCIKLNISHCDWSNIVYIKQKWLLCLTFPPQSFEKQGFHAGTPAASFSLPSALGSGGPINPPAAAGYAPAPFMHILAPHQQPHSQILHHHLQQDGQVVYMFLLTSLSPSVGALHFHTCGSVQLVRTKKRSFWLPFSSDLFCVHTVWLLTF